MTHCSILATLSASILFLPAMCFTYAGDVRGKVTMPPYCSPEISPAVVWLMPNKSAETENSDDKNKSEPNPAEELALVRQVALQFVPRIMVLKKGQTVRFTNEDSEFHNIHVQARGELFNQTMPPGQPENFEPKTTGILKVQCDIHQYMRAFLIIQDTPWIMACSPKGEYRFSHVPAGEYVMTLWHEMGAKPVSLRIEVPESGLELETIALSDATAAPSRSSLIRTKVPADWTDEIDKIAVRLSSALEACKSGKASDRASELAESAYRSEYRTSAIRAAVRTHLGPERSKEIEQKFERFLAEIQENSDTMIPSTGSASAAMRSILASLTTASADLKSKGFTSPAAFRESQTEEERSESSNPRDANDGGKSPNNQDDQNR